MTSSTSLARRRPLAAVAVTLLLLGGIAACSSDDGDDTAGDPGASTTGDPGAAAADPAVAVEVFDGTDDDFYVVPDPLPAGEPGDLIRLEDLGESAGVRTWRVMYHSRDAQDRDRAVTGLITHPTGGAPEGGWPVVAWAHGTAGLAAPCAPSRAGGVAPGFGIEGVHVATDYVGLGPVGERHPYLSAPSQAHSVVDAVRAARQLDDLPVSDAWVAIGHSQGGHAALWTNELGAAYAPELDLRGTVAVAPAAALGETFGDHDQVIPRIVGLMALYGWEADYPELDVEDYVSPQVAAVDDVIDEGCADDIINTFVTIPLDQHFSVDPLVTEPAASIAEANDPGQEAVESPLLLVAGTADVYVVPERVEFLLDRLCGIGQVADHLVVEGADHGTVVPQAGPEITAWLQARLDGDPAPTAC